MNDRAPSYQWKSLKETNRFTSSPFILHPFFRNCLHLNPFSRHYYTIILSIAVISLVGSRGTSFQPCNVPRRIKGFALRLVKSEELRMENASPTGTCRTGETRRTINQTIRRIYHCPDPHLPLLLNSSNHQSHLSHMSHSSHYSNSGAEHTPNSSIHPLTFSPFGRFSASKTRLYQRSFIAPSDIADFPCPPSAEIRLNYTIP